MDVVRATEGLTRWAPRSQSHGAVDPRQRGKHLPKSPADDLQSSGLPRLGTPRRALSGRLFSTARIRLRRVCRSILEELTTAQKDGAKAVAVDDSRTGGALRRWKRAPRREGRLPEGYAVARIPRGGLPNARRQLAGGARREQDPWRVTLENRHCCSFSIPFDVGWSAMVDGKPATLSTRWTSEMTGILLDEAHDGEHPEFHLASLRSGSSSARSASLSTSRWLRVVAHAAPRRRRALTFGSRPVAPQAGPENQFEGRQWVCQQRYGVHRGLGSPSGTFGRMFFFRRDGSKNPRAGVRPAMRHFPSGRLR